MDVLTLLVALAALVAAIMALQRTGGIHELHPQMDDLRSKSEHATQGARDMTTDVLNRLETFMRGQQPPSSPEEKPPAHPPMREDKP